MSDFRYVAHELSGREVTGVVSADNQQEALQQLAARKLFPVKVTPADATRRFLWPSAWPVRASRIAGFYSQLADLLLGGVPLLRSLALMQRKTKDARFQKIVADIHDQVANGSRLADAFALHPNVFSDLAVSMVRAGEEGSFLEDALQRVAEFTRKRELLKNQVVGAMVYPAFLLVTGTIIVTCMMIFFVPKFEPIFERLSERGELPWATSALMGFSNLLKNYGLLAGAMIVVAVVLLLRYLKTKSGRLRWDRLRLTLRPTGSLVRSLAIARFCRVLGTLMRSGVPLLRALQISKDAAGNLVIGQTIAVAAEEVTAGRSLAAPLESSGQFPEEVVEMITVAEESNNLEHILIQIADRLEEQAQIRLALLVRLLEPCMLLIMAGMVLFVVAALLLPIFQSSGIV